MGLGENGEVVNFLDPDGRCDWPRDLDVGKLGFLDAGLISVNVSFMFMNAILVEETSHFDILNSNSVHNMKDGISDSSSSGSKKDSRTWKGGIFYKMVDCSPTVYRQLQGLWKGVSGYDTSMVFYHVTCDDFGDVTCRRVGKSSRSLLVFWTAYCTVIVSPFPSREEYIYASRTHLQLSMAEKYFSGNSHHAPVSRIMHISSSFGFRIPNLEEISTFPGSSQEEGRVWQYQNGTFGFGFLHDSFIVDLKRITLDGCLIDVIGPGS